MGALTALERNDIYWHQINGCFHWQFEADKVIMDCVSERVYMDVFMGMWPSLHTLAHVHVNMSRGNHKSAELKILRPVI